MESLFVLENAAVSYPGVQALDGVSLTVSKGERVCVIGPSGSGKTTLMGLLNARVRATEGTVEVLGKNLAQIGVRELRELRAKISWVPQDLGLVGNLRVIQNVLSGSGGRLGSLAFLRRLFFPKMAEAEVAHEILQRVGIPEKLYARTSHLSGGQQQRVAIARALYQEPELILADEPVSAVDPARAQRLVTLLGEVAAEDNLALVMSLHDVRLAREFFPRLIGLRAGKVFFDKASEKVTEGDLEKLYRADEMGEDGL